MKAACKYYLSLIVFTILFYGVVILWVKEKFLTVEGRIRGPCGSTILGSGRLHFFRAYEREAKIEHRSAKKNERERTKAPSTKEKSANLHFSSLGHTTLKTQFQSTKPQAGGSSGVQQDVNKI